MKIVPFCAHRPVSSEAARAVSCPPYDVISTDEARAMAAGRKDSFLQVIRPEISFSEGQNLYADEVYEMGRASLQRLLKSPLFTQEQVKSLYVYRLTMLGRASTGVFTCVSVSDYNSGKILKHELTRPDKEDDRTRHILAQQAHAEPVMLVHQKSEALSALLDAAVATEPLLDIVSDDGVGHTIWRVSDPEAFLQVYAAIPRFYVADGHHRCAAASRAANEATEIRSNGQSGSAGTAAVFPAVLFPDGQMSIMAYNRVVFECSDEDLARMWSAFEVVATGEKNPSVKGDVAVYTRDGWKTIRLHDMPPGASPVDTLDAGRLQSQLLGPLLGIEDPRTSSNVAFIGGIRGAAELERYVDSGGAAIAFSMYPTSVQELMDVSDAGLLMPPKSTWFEPKLRSGLLVHTFGR
jgi:uncharacterized protein (DUF1015 family)